MTCLLFGISMLCIGPLAARAEDWPQFQGADRTGLSSEASLAHNWPSTGVHARWTTVLASGFGGAIVQDGQVFIMDRVGEGMQGQDILHCLHLADGKEIWRFSYAAPGEFDFPGARGTPAIDAECVYTLGPLGHLYCLGRYTHSPRWHANLLHDFHGPCPRWGVTQSPLLFQDVLIVAPQSSSTGVVALDKRTGKIRWASAPLGLMSYASPFLTRIDGIAQIVMLTSGKTYTANTIVAGIDPANGRVLWRYTGWKCLIPIPCPTPLGQGRFFLTGMDSKSLIFQVFHEGNRWRCHTLVRNIPCASALQNAVLYQEHLYLNSASTAQGLCCLDLKGQVVWSHNTIPPMDKGGSLIIADGMLYFANDRNGMLYLAVANAKRYRELAAMQALTPKMNWAPMALSEGKLLVRDREHLQCFDVKDESDKSVKPVR